MERLKIRDLAASERPYEKLEKQGAEALSQVELLAVLLCNGSAGFNSLDLAQSILARGQSLAYLYEASLEELRSLPGIGRVKALRLKALAELCRRYRLSKPEEQPTICQPDDAFSMVQEMAELPQEELHVLLLNNRQQLIRRYQVCKGTLNCASTTPRDVFREACKANAAALILCHNHPSGNPEPSEQDVTLTHQYQDLGSRLGIPVLDHIVVGRLACVSLKQRQLM